MAISTYRPESINWQSFTRKRPIEFDFVIITGTDRELIETKKVAEQAYHGQILQSFFELYLAKESLNWQNRAISKVITQEFTPPIIAKHFVNVIYDNRNTVETLLGSQGKRVLGKVLNLVQEVADEEKWPLAKIEIQVVNDLELTDMEHILLIFCFNTDFNTANKYLYNYYERLDTLNDTLNDEEQDILTRLIFFDVKAEHSLSIS